MSLAQGSSAYNSAYNSQTVAPPQPTDMQTHVQRAQEAAKRLCGIHDNLMSLVGRLYGEGGPGTIDGKAGPRVAGLSSEMTDALSGIDGMADQIDHLVKRLCSFA